MQIQFIVFTYSFYTCKWFARDTQTCSPEENQNKAHSFNKHLGAGNMPILDNENNHQALTHTVNACQAEDWTMNKQVNQYVK